MSEHQRQTTEETLTAYAAEYGTGDWPELHISMGDPSSLNVVLALEELAVLANQGYVSLSDSDFMGTPHVDVKVTWGGKAYFVQLAAREV